MRITTVVDGRGRKGKRRGKFLPGEVRGIRTCLSLKGPEGKKTSAKRKYKSFGKDRQKGGKDFRQ